MRRRSVINGKVMRTPSPDDILPPTHEVPDFDAKYAEFDDGDTSTKAADKALLESLGVDGRVPLAQARINAGLDAPPGFELKDWRWLVRQIDAGLVANNNNKQVALAA